MPPAISTSPARTPSGIAILCQMGWCGVRRRLRTRVDIRSDCTEEPERVAPGQWPRNPACHAIGSRTAAAGKAEREKKMKLVIGIVRPEQANQVLEALH